MSSLCNCHLLALGAVKCVCAFVPCSSPGPMQTCLSVLGTAVSSELTTPGVCVGREAVHSKQLRNRGIRLNAVT